MRAGRSWPLAAALLAVLALAAPAAAHDYGMGSSWLIEADHPGWYWPSTSSQTSNFEMVGSVHRTRRDSTYRNSDLAFWGRLAYAGHYDGFQIIDAGNPRKPERLVDFSCPGSQHDVSVWQNLLFVSVETPRSSPACDSVTQSPGFEGIRIFDVSNPALAAPHHRRADRLRLAHAHAGAGPAQPPGAALRRVLHVADERPGAVGVRERVPAL